jgi:hypothetical protein
VDLATGEPSRVRLPGRYGEVVAFLDGRYAIYQALPTQGSPVVRSPYGSFRAGLQMITLKLADVDTGDFQTVVPVIDPRWRVSMGAAARPGAAGR